MWVKKVNLAMTYQPLNSKLIKEKLNDMGMVLPSPIKPVGSYRALVVSGGFGFMSGQISKKSDGDLCVGKVGVNLTLEEGQLAAEAAALNVLSVIDSELGFEKLGRLVRVVGYVQCSPDFDDIHKVMNGASDLFERVLGEAGIHARSAVGMASLPLNCAVEIEVTLEVRS